MQCTYAYILQKYVSIKPNQRQEYCTAQEVKQEMLCWALYSYMTYVNQLKRYRTLCIATSCIWTDRL